MNRKPFAVILLLSILYFALTVCETDIYQNWREASDQQAQIQARLAAASQLNDATQRLLRRLAIDSVHDKALAQILSEHGLKVTVSNPPVSNPNSAPASATAPVPPTSETSSPAPATPGAHQP